ncbi:expansin EXLX1 family cellulose-binding protein [Asanoa sp. WMMD1127]|uniref:expansin EXLX1 family cellulose-binding protein n=1 Tax=Asanoa sp. WMMD1127 TaxID=3016107 RepID=UPI002415BEB8|nr:expansin EXLX1 family cellulose-binding protein [Asanoa sp. WMMD1127]MDG4825782.1 expansin EXLX1 family cellulose-binding protein [Asanoa sp. WMMD1127]
MTGAWQRRWWLVGGVLVLAAAVTAVFALRGAGSACAAAATSGKATFYTDSGGNCSFPSPPDDRLFVALSPDEYADGAKCGGYLDVKGPDGSVRVKVVDQCPPCESGHIDLSREAFAKIGDPVDGIIPVTYTTVASPRTDNLTFRIKEGASAYWFAVLVDNTGNALRSVQAKGPGGSWRSAHREPYNYWLIDGGIGSGPYSIRVTDVRGRQATATGVKLSPGTTQTSGVRLGGAGTAPAVKKSPTKKPTPKPTASPTPTAVAPTTRPAVPPTEAAVLAGGEAGLGSRCD